MAAVAVAAAIGSCASCSPVREKALVGSVTPEMSEQLAERTGLAVADAGAPSCTRVYRASFRNAILEIHPDETMCWELTADHDVAMEPVAIDPGTADPQRTIVLRMWQDAGGHNTFLTFRNPFARALKYSAQLLQPHGDVFLPTTACPVRGQRFTIEQWPQTLVAIRIADASFVDDADAVSCE
ncbi:MAG TPA: hypothetical protein VGK20_01230 [Candidatus Binatia bacterium]|jgi:hypothetical protein